MRTTVTLDPDTAALIRQRMREYSLTFKQALNDAVRAGARSSAPAFHTQVADLGEPLLDLDKALQVAAVLEDEEQARKMQAGR